MALWGISTAETRRNLISSYTQKNWTPCARKILDYGTHSRLSVPLVRGGVAIGAMQAINKAQSRLFEQADLELYRAIADIAALALENALLFSQLEGSYNATLEALSTALDQRDHETVLAPRRPAP